MACVPITRFGPDRDSTGWRSYLGAPRHDASATESLTTSPRGPLEEPPLVRQRQLVLVSGGGTVEVFQ